MSFAPGSLVTARGREWIVLPESTDELLLVRPVAGTDDETTGILRGVEPVDTASFSWPNPDQVGDFRSAKLLRDALRLGFRSSAGPFRSFGSIAVEPHPYQLVPLLMSLRLDPVRLLIADDTGTGKTIEAGLIAAEALATGTANRLAVLTPPHLAEQWQRELADKFHIDTELVLPSTAPRLDRGLAVGQSLFELHPHVVVSTDFIKADRRRDEFARTCPEFVIVDEAHTCAGDTSGRGRRHQRHQLVSLLAQNDRRHLVLVTATPHSGKEETFRSLLGLLDPALAELPPDLSGKEHEADRRLLARHLVQRRRGDLSRGDLAERLKEETPFPVRKDAEDTYTLHPDYRKLFDRALAFARESVQNPTGGEHRKRVRWWSALAMLRSLASSPAAAAATLRTRAESAETHTAEEADAVGERLLFDLGEEEADAPDVVPGAISEDDGDEADLREAPAGSPRRRLLEMARAAEHLEGERDAKLQRALDLVAGLVEDGFAPIVFCRFIPTASYVGAALRAHLGDDVTVEVVTGDIPPAEREQRVGELGNADRKVLVATDCLSEGINLQDHFNAVMHYDLAWSPTKHEQREGRVDRFNQGLDEVRVLTYYGVDTQIDGIVLDVLLRKHTKIRKSTGVAVPVPAASGEVLEAIFEGLLLRGKTARHDQPSLFDDDPSESRRAALHTEWEEAANREKQSRRSMFAQHAIKVDEVVRELQATRSAIGTNDDVADFVRVAVDAHNGAVTDAGDRVEVNLTHAPPAVRDLAPDEHFAATYSLPAPDGAAYLSRTHPFVDGLASHVLTSALDELGDPAAARAGCIRTKAVEERTTLLVVRYRFDVVTTRGSDTRTLLAEDCATVAFTGAPDEPSWLPSDAVDALLEARPDGNVAAAQASDFVAKAVKAAPALQDPLNEQASRRAEELLDAHRRVRTEAGVRGVRYDVKAHLPPDVLAVYVLLPVPQSPTRSPG